MNNNEDLAQENKKYGKFANAEALLTAYENLEREFTKKSQKLKQLEKIAPCDNEETSPQGTAEKLCKEVPSNCDGADSPEQQNCVHGVGANNAEQSGCVEGIAADKPKQLYSAENTAVDNPEQSNGKFNPQQILSDRDFVERHILQNGEITREVLQRYIDFLSKSELPPTINSMAGATVLTPPKKPKTIKEASRLAAKFFDA